VLDFGIAKVLASAVSSHNDDDATPTALDTQAGLVIGTPAYMSPEQARGATVDERTDIWAFGCVLYEMITGWRPFPGTSTAEVIAAVIEREPDWTAVSNVPPSIRRLLRRCLQKDPRRRLRDIGDARLEIDEADAGGEPRPVASDPRKPHRWWRWITTGLTAALIVAAGAWFAYRWMFLTSTRARSDVEFQRITDAVGLEDSPAISPDGKYVAYVALAGGRQQVWVRLLTGGKHIQVTDADLDHEQPRWAPNSNSILYFTRSETEDPQGTLWEVGALGGQSRPIAKALGGGDISHDGRIAAFQLVDNTIRLRILRRDGTLERESMQLPAGPRARTPRWAPDGRSVAYLELRSGAFSHVLTVASMTGDEPKVLAEGSAIKGLAWIPDGSGLVFGSAEGSTILYPPTFQLRLVRLAGGDSEQLTFGAESYTHPDVHGASGLLLATRTQLRSALSKVPTTDAPTANAQGAVPLTHETSQVQTPSASQDGKRIVYLSDSGGHGNIWGTDADGRERVQITQVRDPAVSIGVPVLSPDGSQIANIRRTVEVTNEQWLINSDGSGERKLLGNGSAAWWSPRGDWLYYAVRSREFCIERLHVADPNARGEPIRCGDVIAPMPHRDGSLFFQRQLPAPNGGFNYEIHRASSDRGESIPLLKIDGRRLPYDSTFAVPTAFSPDGKWLAFVMMDGNTANLWKLPTTGGNAQKITDFGSRALWIVRQIAWPDGQFIYAAIADVDADIVSITGLVGAKRK
jgi:eukaryotic-like serine/threonine-protein kinase